MLHMLMTGGVGLYCDVFGAVGFTCCHVTHDCRFSLFIIDNYTVFASFYVEDIAGGNVSSLQF